MTCPRFTRQDLERYHQQIDPPSEWEEVERHILTCRLCNETLKQLAEESELISRQRTSVLFALDEASLPGDLHGATTFDPADPAALGFSSGQRPQRGTPTTIGAYQILSTLGSGGFGVVYKVKHQTTDRIEALKVLRTKEVLNAQELQSFKAEAQQLARLDHPHIVKIYHASVTDDCFFLSMEYVEGESLSLLLSRGKVPLPQALQILREIAAAVAAAHEANIIHRDLKPGNVLIRTDGHVQLVDFGIALQLQDNQSLVTRERVGTRGYMAPEFLKSGTVSPAMDVFAIGVIMHELLAGRRPESPEPTAAEIERTPSGTNSYLKFICARCLAANPQERYSDASELLQDLHRFQNGRRPNNAPVLDLRWEIEQTWRRWRVAALSVACLLLVLATAAYWQASSQAASKRVAREKIQRHLEQANTHIELLQKSEAARELSQAIALADTAPRQPDLRAAAQTQLDQIGPTVEAQERSRRFSEAFENVRFQQIKVTDATSSRAAWLRYIVDHENALAAMGALEPGDGWIKTSNLALLTPATQTRVRSQVATLRASLWDAEKESGWRPASLTQLGFHLAGRSPSDVALPRIWIVDADKGAAFAGLLNEDRVLEVDGKSAIGITPEQAAETVYGPKTGGKTTLTILRSGRQEPISLEIERRADSRDDLKFTVPSPPFLVASAGPKSIDELLLFMNGKPADGIIPGRSFPWPAMVDVCQSARDEIRLEVLSISDRTLRTHTVKWPEKARLAQREAIAEYYFQDMLTDTLGGVEAALISKDPSLLRGFGITDPNSTVEDCLTDYYVKEFGLPADLIRAVARRANQAQDFPDYREALRLSARKEYSAAIQKCYEEIARHEEFAAAWRVAGLSAEREDNLAAAIDCYSRFHKIHPNNANNLLMRGRCHALLSQEGRSGEKELAEADLSRALEINPELPNGREFAAILKLLD